MVDGAHGLTGHHVLKCVLDGHHVLGAVRIRESDNAFASILHPSEVEKTVLVTVARKKLVKLEVSQVAM